MGIILTILKEGNIPTYKIEGKEILKSMALERPNPV